MRRNLEFLKAIITSFSSCSSGCFEHESNEVGGERKSSLVRVNVCAFFLLLCSPFLGRNRECLFHKSWSNVLWCFLFFQVWKMARTRRKRAWFWPGSLLRGEREGIFACVLLFSFVFDRSKPLALAGEVMFSPDCVRCSDEVDIIIIIGSTPGLAHDPGWERLGPRPHVPSWAWIRNKISLSLSLSRLQPRNNDDKEEK